jgi:hypothetical protein
MYHDSKFSRAFTSRNEICVDFYKFPEGTFAASGSICKELKELKRFSSACINGWSQVPRSTLRFAIISRADPVANWVNQSVHKKTTKSKILEEASHAVES